MTTSRLETLADGVFAIVMTLLVFDISLPVRDTFTNGELAEALALLVPNLLSFVLSFLILGVYWIGHHRQFQYIQHTNQPLLWLNIIFLMMVSLIPFTASLLGQQGTKQLAVVVYGSNLIATSLAQYAIWWYATRHLRLVDDDLDPIIVRQGRRLSLLPPLVYTIAILASFISPGLSVLLYALMLIPYISGVIYHWGG